MKRLVFLLCMVMLFSGCTTELERLFLPDDIYKAIPEMITTESAAEKVTEEETEPVTESEKESLFVQMPESYTFSSGAGAWGTVIDVDDEGYFVGDFHDSDMGDIDYGYPNGVVYKCEFNGKFTEPLKIDDYTYTMRLEYLNIVTPTGTEEIINGTKYIYSDPYGFDDAEAFMVYLPGKPISELTEEYISWDYDARISDSAYLQHYSIYNVNGMMAFVS